MRIALATPPGGFNNKGYLPHLGLGYIASSLEKAGHRIRIFDFTAKSIADNEACDELLNFDPAVVGMTSVTSDRFEAMRLLRLLKSENPDLFITAGGPHFSITAHDALQNEPALDAVILGEGEITFNRLVYALEKKEDLSRIKGLVLRYNREIISTGQPDRIDNIDELPQPAWQLFNHDLYRDYRVKGFSGRITGVISSRGCPYRCAFCSSPSFWGRRYNLRSPKLFVDEIERLYREFDYNSFIFWDDTFTVNREHVERVCTEIYTLKLDIKWIAAARVNLANRQLFRTMRRAGCVGVNFGIESGSDRILKSIHKETTASNSFSAVKMAVEEGLNVRAFFIFGHPDETTEDVVQTVELIDRLRSLGKGVSTEYGYLAIFPGTEVEKTAIDRGILAADFSWNHWLDEYDELSPEVPKVPFYANPNVDRDKLQAHLWRLDLKSFSGIFRMFKRAFTPGSTQRIREGLRIFRKTTI